MKKNKEQIGQQIGEILGNISNMLLVGGFGYKTGKKFSRGVASSFTDKTRNKNIAGVVGGIAGAKAFNELIGNDLRTVLVKAGKNIGGSLGKKLDGIKKASEGKQMSNLFNYWLEKQAEARDGELLQKGTNTMGPSAITGALLGGVLGGASGRNLGSRLLNGGLGLAGGFGGGTLAGVFLNDIINSKDQRAQIYGADRKGSAKNMASQIKKKNQQAFKQMLASGDFTKEDIKNFSQVDEKNLAKIYGV